MLLNLAIIAALSVYSTSYSQIGGNEAMAILPISLLVSYIVPPKQCNMLYLILGNAYFIYQSILSNQGKYTPDILIKKNSVLCLIYSLIWYLLNHDICKALTMNIISIFICYTSVLLLHM